MSVEGCEVEFGKRGKVRYVQTALTADAIAVIARAAHAKGMSAEGLVSRMVWREVDKLRVLEGGRVDKTRGEDIRDVSSNAEGCEG